MGTRQWPCVAFYGLILILGLGRLDADELKRIPGEPEPAKPLALRVLETFWRSFEGDLKQRGYSVDTLDQIKEAAKSPRVEIRWSALYVLVHRSRHEAMPVLKEGLKDPAVQVRVEAARLLGALGDRSGIPILRRDLGVLAPRNGIPDPNLKDLQGMELRRAKSRRVQDLRDALEVANALSEMGDAGGLELAARMALESEYASFRKQAITVLVNLLLSVGSGPKGQAIDPEAVLMAVAESEKETNVVSHLDGQAARLPDPIAIRLLEKIAVSPHLSDEDRKVVQSSLRWRKSEAKRMERERQAQAGAKGGATPK